MEWFEVQHLKPQFVNTVRVPAIIYFEKNHLC